jgi:hypothetical protein
MTEENIIEKINNLEKKHKMENQNQNVILGMNLSDRPSFIDYMDRFYNLFKEKPNCIELRYYNEKKLKKWKEEKKEKLLEEIEFHVVKDNKICLSKKVSIYENGLFLFEWGLNYTFPHIYVIYRREIKEEAMNLANLIKTKVKLEKEKSEPKLNLIALDRNNNFQLIRFNINKTNLNIELNYGSVFKKKYDNILKRLKANNNKGIVLFHGEPGTGKTTIIRKLIDELSEYKKLIYLPSDLANDLGNPAFLTFMMQNPNSILIIEDAENAIKKREESSNSAIHNILNMTDGLLSDCLSIQIICSFNIELSKIDEALLRDGRLIERHEFGKLTEEQVIKIAEKEGIQLKTNEVIPMTISKLYSYKEEKNNQD